MTQTHRWLAPLVLLLAFTARTVRAEEEDYEAPLKPTFVELLPAPHALPVDMPVLSPVGWLFQFPSPTICPAGFAPAAFVGYGQTCPACPGCAACTCRQAALEDMQQYVVELKMMKAGDDSVVACPRLTVFEGQTAKVQLHGVETTKERSSLQLQVTMKKQAKGALLDLSVLNAMTCNDGESGLRSYTETAESQCAIQFGQPHKMALKHDADGKETAWMEVTVREINQDLIQKATAVEPVPAAPESAATDSGDSALGYITEVVEDVLDTVADAAAELFSPEPVEQVQDLRSAEYVEHQPQYVAPLPMPRELAAQAVCPNSTGSTCVQCAASEAVRKSAMHISIDATHDRKCVEMSDGKKRFKATADRLTVQDDCIQLEGDVRGESCDDSCHDCMVIKADKILVQHKEEGLKIHIND